MLTGLLKVILVSVMGNPDAGTTGNGAGIQSGWLLALLLKSVSWLISERIQMIQAERSGLKIHSLWLFFLTWLQIIMSLICHKPVKAFLAAAEK